jgi:predicted XRE-type DNA-binding protein
LVVGEEMSNERFASVWDAIEDTPAEAEDMKLRSELMMQLQAHISRTGMSAADAAQLFGVTQHRASALIRGKINLFDRDELMNMVAAIRA